MHNAYLYDKNGDRVGGLVFNKGSIIHTSGIRKIGGVDCYVLKVNSNTYYIVASNFVARQVALKHNAYIFDENGKRVNNQVLKTGSNVNIYGDAVTIKGHKYFITDNGYVKAGNFKKVISNPNGTLHYSNATTGKKLMHNTYIFNTSTNKLSSVELAAGSVIDTTNSKDINGVKYYALDDNNYVAADNIDGVQTKTIKKARVYNKYGKKTKVVKKGKTIIIYGVPVSINGHSYYTIGKNRFIKVSTVR
nr:SLAP domain-containing protein [Lactobacillus sp. ESL0679]